MAEGAPVSFEVDPMFRPSLARTLLRLGYLFPNWHIDASVAGDRVSVVTPDPASVVQRELAYALYREHILSQTLPLRAQMHERLFGR